MKKLLAALLLLPTLAFSAANDLVITQRNSTDTGLGPNRLFAAPTDGSNVFFGFNGTTFLPAPWGLGAGFSIASGKVTYTTDWPTITNKPTFFTGAYSALTGVPSTFAPSAHTHPFTEITGTLPYSRVSATPVLSAVATSGAYSDLSGLPSIPTAQVNSDWNSTSGLSQILNKPVLFSGSYTDLTSKPTLFDGTWSSLTGKPTLATVATTGSYTDLSNLPSIPAAQVQTDWNATTGLGLLLNKPILFSGAYSDLTGKPTLFDGTWTSLVGKPTTLAGYGITDGVTQTSLISSLGSYATTSALTSGLATKFNTPTGTTSQYLRGDGSLAIFPTLPVGTVTSVTAGTGLSGGTITGSGTISMPNTGTAGTYGIVTTDAQGRVTAGRARSFTYPTRTLNTAFQISTTQDAQVNYTVDISVTSLLIAGTSGRVYLEYADNAAMTTNLVTVNESPNSVGGVLSITNVGPGNVRGWVPVGKYVRIRTANVSGTPTFTFVRAEEVLE